MASVSADPRLARQGYSADEVDRYLRTSGLKHSVRFDLLDTSPDTSAEVEGVRKGDFPVVGTLDTVFRKPGAAKVQQSGEQKLSGDLKLEMAPDDRLRDTEFQFGVKPVYLLQIPNRDVLEFDCGVYAYGGADRDLDPRDERWSLQLADQSGWMDTAGTWWGGFGIGMGELYTDGLKNLLDMAHILDHTGVHASSTQVDHEAIWGFDRWPDYTDGYYGTFMYWNNSEKTVSVRTTTMLDIAIDIHTAIAYYPPHFTRRGRYIARPVNDIRNPEPVAQFGYSSDSITFRDITTASDRTKMCNAVWVYSENLKNELGETGSTFIGYADADHYYPDHPYAQNKIGHYMTRTVSSPWATSPAAADAIAFSELAAGLTYAQTIEYETFAYPTLEVYDVNTLYVPGDHELDTPQPYIKATIDFDLFAGRMKHTDRRIVIQGGDLGYIDVGLTEPWNKANRLPS